MIITYTNKSYRITYDGISMIENALDNPKLIQISAISGCTIIVAPNQYGISYLPNGDFQSWNLTGINTALARVEAHNIYARLNRESKDALIVLSVNDYGFNGNILGEPDSAESNDYYYIKIGHITETNEAIPPTKKRELTYDGGYLNTPQNNDEDKNGWKLLFRLTENNLIMPLKRFTSFIVEGTLTILGKIVLNDKVVSNVSQNIDDEVDVSDESVPTTSYLHDKFTYRFLSNIFLRKDKPDETEFLMKFLGGLYSEYIHSDYIRSGSYSAGTLGEGFVIKVDPVTKKSYIEVDELFVRIKAMFTELEIKKLSYTGGNYIFSAAGMKCAKVEEYDTYWRCYLMVDDGATAVENPFREDDQVRFQEFNIKPGVYENVSNRYYWRLCVGTGDDYIDLSKTDCDAISDAPQEGDSLVQLGNRTDKSRQNAIELSVYGDDAPSIHQYAGIDSYTMAGKEVTVISPKGNKFMGDFFLKTGTNILTQFQVLENLIRSEISSIRDEVQAKDNYLYNAAFASNTDGWETSSNIRFFTVNGKFLYFDDKFYSRKDKMAAIVQYGDRSVLRIIGSGIKQTNENLSKRPEYNIGEDAKKFFISFSYRVVREGTITIGFQNQNLYFSERLDVNDNYSIKEYSGTWDGSGDFELKFTGEIYLHSLAITDNALEDMITMFNTKIEQTNESISAVAERTTNLEKASAGWITSADGNRLWATKELENGETIVSIINQTAESVAITAKHIRLEGIITANGNIKIHEDGSIEANNGKFNGQITATSGRIGSFNITDTGLSNIDDNPKARITIEKTGGRFFRVNDPSDAMCSIRGDGMTALGISAFGVKSVGISCVAQAGYNAVALKTTGNVSLLTREGESVMIDRLRTSGLYLNTNKFGPNGPIFNDVLPVYNVKETDDFIVFDRTSVNFDPVLYLPKSPFAGKVVYIKNGLNRNISIRADSLMNANNAGISSSMSLNQISAMFIYDGENWVYYFCG